MEYQDIFSPQTLEKLNKKSAETLKDMLGNKTLMQTLISSQDILNQIAKAEAPYKSQLEQLAVNIMKELYPVIDEEGIIIDAKLGSISDVNKSLDEIKINKPNDPINSLTRLLDAIPNEKYFQILSDYEGEEQWDHLDLLEVLYDSLFDNELKGKPGVKYNSYQELIDAEDEKYDGNLGPLGFLIVNKAVSIVNAYINGQEELGEIQINKPEKRKWTNQTLYDALRNKGMDLNAATIWDESDETNISLETYEAYSKEEVLKYIKSLGFQVLESTTRQNTIPSVHGDYYYEWYITCKNPNPKKPEINDGNDLWELMKPEFELDIKELLDEIQVNKPKIGSTKDQMLDKGEYKINGNTYEVLEFDPWGGGWGGTHPPTKNHVWLQKKGTKASDTHQGNYIDYRKILDTLDEIQVNKPDMFKSLVKSYTKYLESISRAEMFDESGNYNSTLKDYHNKLKQYIENGTKKEKEIAGFILSWI